MKTTISALLGGMMAMLLCSTGKGQQIIYSNSFNGGQGTISNTAPTEANSYAGGTNTALWIMTYTNALDGGWLADGAIGTNAGSVLLPFKPQSGAIYYLTASVYMPAVNNWIGLGFCQSATQGNNSTAERFTDSNVKGGPWMSAREGTTVNFYGGPETSLGSAAVDVEPTVGTYTLTIVLNTFGTKWVTGAFINSTIQGTNVVGGTQLGTNIVYGANPTIGYAGFTQQAISPSTLQIGYMALSTPLLPILVQQPASGTAYNGVGFTNTVIAVADTNGGTLYYQWYTNNSPIAGATNASLILNPASASYASTNYYVVVTNSWGAVTSSVASLTVDATNIPPQLVGDVQAPFWAEVGGTASNSVTIVGTAPLSYQWLFNGTNLMDNAQITGSQSSNVLTIANAQSGQAGNYQVIVSNSFGSVTSSVAALIVAGIDPITFDVTGAGWTSNQVGTYTAGVISNGALILTDGRASEARSFFFSSPQYIGAFQAAFTYDGTLGADGAAFCLQNDTRGASAVGGDGGQLGVGAGGGHLAISPSVELEFNIYSLNGLGGVGYCFDTNGAIGAITAPGSVVLTNDPVDVSINYANGQMAVSFSNELTAATFSTTLVVGDLTQALGTNTAYVGFTGSCGGVTSVQTISNFSFVSIPKVAIQPGGPGALISWPVAGYGLQQNSDLTTTNWSNVTNQPVFTNNGYQVIIPPGASNQFYRLTLQP